MESILLRTLTKKSKIKFGAHKEKTVQHMLDLNKQKDLISYYYKLTTINYIDEILDELDISSEWKIEKPGSNKELHLKFLKEKNYKKKRKTSYKF